MDVWGSALNRKAYAELGLCLDLDVPGKNVRVSGLSLDFLGLKATGSLYLDLTGKAPALSGRLRLAEFSPKGLAAGLGLELPTLADPAALNSLAAEFSFSAGRETTLDLDKAVLDGSRLQGRARITDQGREVRFSLAMDRLDLDRYLPRRPEAGRACWPKPLNGLDLAGEIEIKDLKVKNLRLSEIKTELSASGGVVELGPLSARLYQGALLGRMVLDAAGPGPALCKSGSLRGVDAAALLEDLLGAAPLSGSLHLRARLCPPGPGPDGLKASASFFLRQGALSGVDLADLALNGPGQKDKEAAGSTAFSELSGSLDIAEGRATITGLVLRAPGLLVTGQGGADLSARTLDCLLTADAPGGRATLIRVSGDMARPKYSLEPDRGVSLGNRALLGQGPG
ncbi:MAG: AsmA-like C-terminal region-containing protein [Desulfovibrionaceae bacterium]|nr:AsmA-like C-terminal region-containing protein [Desulfovibrionaceae bacterium]